MGIHGDKPQSTRDYVLQSVKNVQKGHWDNLWYILQIMEIAGIAVFRAVD